MRSVKNLLALTQLASRISRTKEVVKFFAQLPEKGGVLLAGMMVAKELVHVLTSTRTVTKNVHAGIVVAAAVTSACKRLEKVGAETADKHKIIVACLSDKLKLRSYRADSGMCESLRWKHSSRTH